MTVALHPPQHDPSCLLLPSFMSLRSCLVCRHKDASRQVFTISDSSFFTRLSRFQSLAVLYNTPKMPQHKATAQTPTPQCVYEHPGRPSASIRLVGDTQVSGISGLSILEKGRNLIYLRLHTSSSYLRRLLFLAGVKASVFHLTRPPDAVSARSITPRAEQAKDTGRGNP